MTRQENGGPPAPRANTELTGHVQAEQTLLAAWESGRMPHAWLIAGRQGIGKATLAFRFARFVLVQAATGGGGAGLFGDAPPPADGLAVPADHPVARRVAAGGHCDMLTVQRSINPKNGKPRTEIVVDDVRRLGAFLALTTAEGSWRAVVVDAADEMNATAANALLKGLEEPPPRTVFLLVSHMPGRLLATIRSRCRTLTLAPLAEDTIVDLMARYAPDAPAGDARALARLSEGSIGQALVLHGAGGLELYRELSGLMDRLGALDIAAVHALGDKVARPGAEQSFAMLGRLVEGWLAGTILERARGGTAGARGGLAKWLGVWDNVARLFAQAGSANLNRKQVVISAFLALDAAARG
jgi:DNA polymerase-3 subunit delta'